MAGVEGGTFRECPQTTRDGGRATSAATAGLDPKPAYLNLGSPQAMIARPWTGRSGSG